MKLSEYFLEKLKENAVLKVENDELFNELYPEYRGSYPLKEKDEEAILRVTLLGAIEDQRKALELSVASKKERLEQKNNSCSNTSEEMHKH